MTYSYLPKDLVGVVIDETKAGCIEIRPGIPCLDLGERKWARVRIGVIDNRHYVEGMAIYSDKIPDEYHVVCYICPGIDSANKLVREYSEPIKKKRKILEIVKTDLDGWVWEDIVDVITKQHPKQLASRFAYRKEEKTGMTVDQAISFIAQETKKKLGSKEEKICIHYQDACEIVDLLTKKLQKKNAAKEQEE